jgi:hypothetical protein
MIGEWKEILTKHAPEWGVPPTGNWNFLVYNNYQPTYSGVNIFWFRNRDRHPLVVTKIFPEQTLPNQEHRNLQDAYACAPAVVPKPFGLYQHGDLWALWMAGIQGTKMTAEFLSEAAIDRFCIGLVAIQKGVASRRPVNPRRHQDCVCAPLEFAIQHCPAISEACHQVLTRFSENYLKRIPVLPQHGDLYNGNIIVNGGANWVIVDWELLGLVDLPGYDLIRFLFSLGDGPAPDRWHGMLLDHAKRVMSRYIKELALDRQELLHLFPVLLANWLYRQPLAEGKALALAALQDCVSRPEVWERALLK